VATATQGRKGELWVASGSGTVITKEPCEAVGLSTTIYHVTAPAKRYLSPAVPILVYANNILQTSGYRIAGGCHIVFDAAPTPPVTVSGAYLTPTETALVENWELNLETEVYDITSLGDSSRVYMSSGLLGWNGSFGRFYESGVGTNPPPWYAKAANNAAVIIVRLFEDHTEGWCWTGWAIPTAWTLSTPVEELETESFEFVGQGECVYTTDET